MLDNLTSALLETVLINDVLSVATSFKESICSEKSLPHTYYLFLDPKTFKIEVSFMAPDF